MSGHEDRVITGALILVVVGVVAWIAWEAWWWVNSGSVVSDLVTVGVWASLAVVALLAFLLAGWLTTVIVVEAPLKALEFREKWGGDDGE